MPPSYRSGFYSPRRGGTPKYPSLWDGCVGAWAPSLGSTGLTLRDESVYGNHGTLTNMDSASDWVVSGGKGALDFDGTDDYVVTSFTSQTLSVFSLSTWIKLNAVAGFGLAELFSTDSTPIFSNGTYFEYQYGLNWLYIKGQSGANSSELEANLINSWNHIAVVVGDGVTRGFLNGTPMPVAMNNREVSSTILQDFSSTINGQLDDLRLYDRALTPSEIRTLATRRGIAYESKRRLAVRSGAATPSGTLVKTLSDASLLSSGTLTAAASGSVTRTLDAATLASTGTVGSGLTATVSVTLAAATLSASGTLVAGLTGSTNTTLANATLSSTGTVAAGASGTVTRTLDNATLSSTGGAAGFVSGSVSSTLAAVTCSSSATLAAGLSGSVTRTLADVVSSATGTVTNGASGSVTRTLASATLSSTGSFGAALTAQVNRALDSCVVSSTGTVSNGATGTLSVQLASATLQSGNVAVGGLRIKVGGEWKNANAFVKVTGTWKNATPFVKVSGVWK